MPELTLSPSQGSMNSATVEQVYMLVHITSGKGVFHVYKLNKNLKFMSVDVKQ
jgi:hypothetical protein